MGSGRVGLYRLVEDGTSWQMMGQNIYGDGASNQSGRSVSLSAGGSTVAIGAPRNDNNGFGSGQVTVHRIDGKRSSWERLGQIMYGDNQGDYIGSSINLLPDGNTLAIGSPGSGGCVRVFSLASRMDIYDADTWNPICQDIVGDENNNNFGASVSRNVGIGIHIRTFRFTSQRVGSDSTRC